VGGRATGEKERERVLPLAAIKTFKVPFLCVPLL